MGDDTDASSLQFMIMMPRWSNTIAPVQYTLNRRMNLPVDRETNIAPNVQSSSKWCLAWIRALENAMDATANPMLGVRATIGVPFEVRCYHRGVTTSFEKNNHLC